MALLTRLIPRLIARIRQEYSGTRLKELDPRTGYDLWAATYDADETANPVLGAERMTVGMRLPSLHGRAVLDLACGTGHYALEAARSDARLVVGLDLSAEMLRQARCKATSHCLPITLVQANQSRLPLASHAFDVVIHAMGTGYAPDLGPLAAELARVLQPDGVAFVSDLHPQGVERGWRRTFAHQEGKVRREMVLKSYPHQMQDYQTAFKQAGLSIAHVFERRIDATIRPFFTAAEALVRYEQYRGLPLLVVFELRRSSPRQLSQEPNAG